MQGLQLDIYMIMCLIISVIYIFYRCFKLHNATFLLDYTIAQRETGYFFDNIHKDLWELKRDYHCNDLLYQDGLTMSTRVKGWTKSVINIPAPPPPIKLIDNSIIFNLLSHLRIT